MLAMAIVLLLTIPAVVFAGHVDKAKSKAKPPTKISADFKFEDDGSTLTITGKAKGLTPGKKYLSLLYGPGAKVKGLDACKGKFGLSNDQMEVGEWDVDDDGKGTLVTDTIDSEPVTKTGEGYAAINKIGTISVRLVTGAPSGGRTPTIVVACGKVK